MAGDEGFAVPLERMARHRRLDVGTLARLADVSEPEVRDLLGGARPSPSLLRRLAPPLGLHTADVFASAGVEVPGDLAPADPWAGAGVPALLRAAVALPPEKRAELRQFVASLPTAQGTTPVPELPAHEQYPASPGGLLMRMARNRNLGWSATARTFLVVTGRYWSAATYGGIGHGRARLTPDLLVDFSAVLGVPAADLAALTGVTLPAAPRSRAPIPLGLAELWDVRRLTVGQLQRVSGVAESMRQ